MAYSIRYRKDIDGLRALAVLSVIFYHYGVPGFSGGYTGVDVFFVISGYLIAGHIAQEISEGRFSLLAFYERRIRRIFPALFFMLLIVSGVAVVVLFPPDLTQFAYYTADVVGFVSNVRFYWNFSGYANEAAQRMSLLHTWSLGVEEQFYLLFPLLMMATGRLRTRRYYLVLFPLMIVSFVGCAIVVRFDPLAAFFLPQYRLWEFILGAVLSAGRWPQINNLRLRAGLASLGLISIAASDLLLSQDTLFPSEFALLPCGGAALILYAGVDRSSPGRWVLENPLSVGIGLISYSLYLFHWPLLVLAQYYTFEPLSPGQRFLLLAAASVIAVFSWRFVERPFRRQRLNRNTVFMLAGAGSLTLFFAAIAVGRGNIAPFWFNRDERALFVSLSPKQAQCESQPSIPNVIEDLCEFGDRTSPPSTLLWGDSYSLAALPGFDAAFSAHHDAGYLSSLAGCPPFLGVEVSPYHPGFGETGMKWLQKLGVGSQLHCAEHNDAVMRSLTASHITKVVLAGRWANYIEPENAATPGEVQVALSDSEMPHGKPMTNADVFSRGLGRLLKKLYSLHIQVFVMDSIPEMPLSVPYEMAAQRRLNTRSDLTIPLAFYKQRQMQTSQILDRLQKTYSLTRLRPQLSLCNLAVCTTERGDHPLYIDSIHLSPWGALAIQPSLDPIWQGM